MQEIYQPDQTTTGKKKMYKPAWASASSADNKPPQIFEDLNNEELAESMLENSPTPAVWPPIVEVLQ